MSQQHRPAGSPASTGGQFTEGRHDEADVALADPPSSGAPKVQGFELAFKQGTSDKFYRVFAWGDDDEGHALVQYGKAGTAGQTKATSYPSLADAEAFAAKQLKAKKSKGYLPTAEAEFEVDTDDLASITAMDLDGQFNRNRGATTDIVAGAGADQRAAQDEAIARAAALAADSDYVPAYTQADVTAALDDLGIDRRTKTQDAPVPMLAVTVPEDELAATLDSRHWVGQRKLDGDRFMVQIEDGVVQVLNRSGQPKVTNIPGAVIASFAPFTEGNWNFDGEIVGRTFHAFDMQHADGYVDADTPFATRHRALTAAVGAIDSPHVRLVGCSGTDGDSKRQLLADVKASKGEGIILRRNDGRYAGGRANGGPLLRHKFTNAAEVYVKSVDPSKESVTLAVRDASGKERIVGSASTIGKGDGRPFAEGDVVEAQFQHVLDPANPVMVQPRIMRRRTDKTAAECSLDQFAEAGTVKDVPADDA
jgi:predicted DNA-binding WGR domain protein